MTNPQAAAQVSMAKARGAQARIHANRLRTLANKPKPKVKA
jgi:hypothetical protein